jgi:hypothetical protein
LYFQPVVRKTIAIPIYNAVSDSNRKINFRHGGNGDFGLSHVDADDIASQMNSKFKNYFANGKKMALNFSSLFCPVSLLYSEICMERNSTRPLN